MNYLNKEEETLRSRIYSMNVETEYNYYKTKLKTILNELNIKTRISQRKKKLSNRKCPKDPAKKYDIGEIMDGIDGNSYIVKEKPNGGKSGIS